MLSAVVPAVVTAIAVLLTPGLKLAKYAFGVVARLAVRVLTPVWKTFRASRFYDPATQFLTDHRGWVILFFALPASFVFDLVMRLQSWYGRTFLSSPHLHDKRVQDVQAQVRRWNADGRRKPMCTARAPWLAMSVRTANYKDDCSRISLPLNDILEVDEKNMTVRCEPGVTFGDLTRTLVPRGLACRIHAEMESLTIGGVTMGMGMEVNSHKHGLMQENVKAFEVVLGDGSLVRATPTENKDLYYTLPWSHGTLGFLVAVEIEIMRVKPYMHMTYIPCKSLDELAERFEHMAKDENGPEYLEATIYSPTTAVIMAGELADVKDKHDRSKINSVNYWFKPWFYKHVETSLTRGQFDEFIPLKHYYHRHTRSIFWELEDMIPFGNHPVYRWLLGWLGAPKVAFLKLTMTKQVREDTINKHVVQEAIIPIEELKPAVRKFHNWFEMYPLLVYPLSIYDHGKDTGLLRAPKNKLPGRKFGVYIDLGAYGVPAVVEKGGKFDAESIIKELEHYTRSVGGYSAPYCDLFCTREEFEAMFDHTNYRKCRRKYKAEGAFPEIFDKVRIQI